MAMTSSMFSLLFEVYISFVFTRGVYSISYLVHLSSGLIFGRLV